MANQISVLDFVNFGHAFELINIFEEGLPLSICFGDSCHHTSLLMFSRMQAVNELGFYVCI